MRVASRSRNARSCVTNITAPRVVGAGTPRATRWRRCRGGWSARRAAAGRAGATSARASSTRRRQPPDSVSTGASAGRSRRESTSSTRCSRRQPSRSSSSCCSRPSRVSASGDGRARPRPRRGDTRRPAPTDRRGLRRPRRRPASCAESGTSCTSRATRMPGCAPHRAAIGRQLAAQDLQQRGLAGAVAADDGDALAGLDLQRRRRRAAEGGRRRGRCGRA